MYNPAPSLTLTLDPQGAPWLVNLVHKLLTEPYHACETETTSEILDGREVGGRGLTMPTGAVSLLDYEHYPFKTRPPKLVRALLYEVRTGQHTFLLPTLLPLLLPSILPPSFPLPTSTCVSPSHTTHHLTVSDGTPRTLHAVRLHPSQLVVGTPAGHQRDHRPRDGWRASLEPEIRAW